jgi:hypothetical protein
MGQLVIKDLPSDVRHAFETRARQAGWHPTALLVSWIESVAAGRMDPPPSPLLSHCDWLQIHFQQAVLHDPFFLAQGAEDKWKRLRTRVKMEGISSGSSAGLQAFDAIDPACCRVILQWLEDTLSRRSAAAAGATPLSGYP